MHTAVIEFPKPVDLRTTTRSLGVGDWDGDSWWWATQTPLGIGTIRISTVRERIVEAAAWGEGAPTLIDRLPYLVGFNDDGFENEVPTALRDLAGRSFGLRLGANRAMAETVLRTVLGQLVTTQEAKSSLRRIVQDLGEVAPGPRSDLRAFPAPQSLSSLGYHDLHRFGVERKRASTVIEVSRRASRIDEALAMGKEDAANRLLAVKGVGAWTVGIAMGEAYGDTDAVPIGDFHLPNTVAWALAGEDRADDDRMLELLEPYRPHRRRVVLMIKYAGIKAPKYGPKTAVRRHL